MADTFSERVVEDILSADKSILGDILSVNPSNLTLVARQKPLSSGKLDLLYLCDNELLLIELKASRFRPEIVQQVNDYYEDLLELQLQHRLIGVEIKKIILVTDASSKDIEHCALHSIRVIIYEPQFVFWQYYQNFKQLAEFLKLQSADYGVVRLGLLNPTLNLLSQGKTLKQIYELEGRSWKTVGNRLSVASSLGLVGKFKRQYFLTDFGNSFIEAAQSTVIERLSEQQAELLGDFVKTNPFYSSITYTISAVLESVFVLSKNLYPVPKEALKDYFVKSVGKGEVWQSARARETATYIFTNYACELEFLTKVDNHFYLTPKGIRAILLLQLNRSLKLIESDI